MRRVAEFIGIAKPRLLVSDNLASRLRLLTELDLAAGQWMPRSAKEEGREAQVLRLRERRPLRDAFGNTPI